MHTHFDIEMFISTPQTKVLAKNRAQQGIISCLCMPQNFSIPIQILSNPGNIYMPGNIIAS